MLYKIYDQTGKVVEEMEIPKEIFDVEFNPDLVHQVVISQRANRRQVSAHTKDRSEVSGGGRKPWPQKGTGRARHGSIRSPLWVGGGVTFGPRKEKNYKKIIPKKMRRKALLMVLSAKAKANSLVLLDKLELDQIKTKKMVEIFKNLPLKEGKTILLALPNLDKRIILSARNIPRVKVMQARELNALDILSSYYLIMPKESIKVIEQTFLSNK